jgi:signal transduction histidine kinase
MWGLGISLVRSGYLYESARYASATAPVTRLLLGVRHRPTANVMTGDRVPDVIRSRRVPAANVRVRLAALYGSLFLVTGAALLALTYVLVRRATAGGSVTDITGSGVTPTGARAMTATSHAIDLHQMLVQSGIALAIMTIASALLGWWIAGRVLAPLRAMTDAAQRISETNLHERLALEGPRDELKDLADTIDGLLARLEAAFDAQRLFVANASHELRTPLAMMRTSLDVAIAKPDGVPAQTRALDTNLREDLDRADRLLESFLMLAQAEHGNFAAVEHVSLDELVSAAIQARRERIAASRIAVHTSLEPVHLRGSETLLARMVENVVENAVRHNQPAGFIEVDCRRVENRALLVVESSGAILDQLSVQELRQPFRRGGADRTRSQNGFGLGLSIVAAVAAAHEGELELQARDQGGLRVLITLPSAAASP